MSQPDTSDELIEQLGDICHKYYLGCNQNKATIDGYEYAYDNEVINLLSMPEAKQAITAHINQAVWQFRKDRQEQYKSLCGCPMCNHHTEAYALTELTNQLEQDKTK